MLSSSLCFCSTTTPRVRKKYLLDRCACQIIKIIPKQELRSCEKNMLKELFAEFEQSLQLVE